MSRGQTSVALLSWFAFLSPLASILGEFPIHTWSTLGQIWCFYRMGELTGDAASHQLCELPQISQKGYSLGVCPRKEGDTRTGIAEKQCWFLKWGKSLRRATTE